MAFSIFVNNYDPNTGIVTIGYTDLPANSTFETSAVGLKGRSAGDTVTIPSYQRNGYDFTVIGYAGGQQTSVSFRTNGTSLGSTTPATPAPTPATPSPVPSSVPPSAPTTPSPSPSGGVLTGESKNGFTDGDQIGFWGSFSPVFARVVSGKLYGIYIELDPAQSTSNYFNRPVKVSRDWLGNIYGDASAAAFFEPNTNLHFSIEPGVQSANFLVTMTAGQPLRRPVASGSMPSTPVPLPPSPVPATPTPANPAAPANPAVTPGAPTVVPQPFVPTTPTVDPEAAKQSKMTMYVLIGVGVAVVGLIIAAFTLNRK